MRSLCSLLLLGALVGGCATTVGAPGTASGIVGPTWHLVALGDAAPTVAGATLTFGGDGRVSGATGCNRFFGAYTLAPNGALALTGVGSTRMACSPEAMTQETRVLDAMNRADRADRAAAVGGRLVLAAGGTPVLTFAASSGTTSSASATLSGTVTYRERIALPPDAQLTVRLLDVSLADAPSVTIAEQTTEKAGRQVPLPFALSYDPSRIDARHRYVVRAEIRDGRGAPLWTTDTATPVLTHGAPTGNVEIRVVQVATGGASGSSDRGALVGPTWRLAEIADASGVALTFEGMSPITLTFGADGRYSGQLDCNRLMGGFTTSADGGLALSHAATTLAACPGPSAAGPFLNVFNSATRYRVDGSRLLVGGAAGSLTFLRDGAPDFGGMLPQETGRDVTYACPEGFSFRTRTGPGELAVWLPERFAGRDGGTYHVLGQTVAASGVQYQDGPVRVWTRGLTDARLEVDGQSFECQARG